MSVNAVESQKENSICQNDNKLNAIIEYYKEDKNKINISIELEELRNISTVNPWFSNRSFFGLWDSFLATDSKVLSKRKRQWLFETETEADKFLNDLVKELKESNYNVKAYKTTVVVEELSL